MVATEHEGGTGGKFRKQPLRRVSSTPYDRPPLAARGICVPPSESEAGGSRWFSKLVDPTSRVIIRSASRLFSVFGKGLAAPPGLFGFRIHASFRTLEARLALSRSGPRSAPSRTPRLCLARQKLDRPRPQWLHPTTSFGSISGFRLCASAWLRLDRLQVRLVPLARVCRLRLPLVRSSSARSGPNGFFFRTFARFRPLRSSGSVSRLVAPSFSFISTRLLHGRLETTSKEKAAGSDSSDLLFFSSTNRSSIGNEGRWL
ncbi:hypothetical protein M5K25_023349 [Dendrobium thyrsiflorum]|uniref:Uncharacterized protein n=1 Tax=Dendrobium thyrsiflorum TaxID=117978 RepID=A0ABD0U8J1_DENTH